MAEALKDRINSDSLRMIGLDIKAAYPSFPVDEFIAFTMDETWGSLELLARGRKITTSLGKFLPSDYKEALGVLDEAIKGSSDFLKFCCPDFVMAYGQDDANLDLSINALGRYTEYSSSELAVRPFIIKHEERMMAQMYEWSKHENEHIRRLSSEGCRPALPWAMGLPKYKKDPSPVLPILEQLKADPSAYVRKSVANNLNDISKTHPDLVLKIAKDWHGKNECTDWIIKHGCRTLLKKGNRDVLAIFGYDDVSSVDVNGFTLGEKSVSIGEELTFSFTIKTSDATKVRLEFGIDYMKANGKRNRKIFQISESFLKANTKKSYEKTHSFENLSTRKHYPGTHSITLIVNGTERGMLDFELK